MVTITTKKSYLQARLSLASKMLQKGNALQVMDFALLEAHGNQLNVLTADSSGCMLVLLSEATTTGDFRACVDIRPIIEVLKALSEQPISIDIHPSGEVVIRHSRGQAQFVWTSADVFPSMPHLNGEKAVDITITAGELLNATESTIGFVYKDELRPQLSGICIEGKDGNLAFASTNQKSLALVKFAGEHSTLRITLPLKTARLIKTTLHASDEIQFSTDGDKVRIATLDSTLTTSLVHGTFPNFYSVIPPIGQNRAIISRAELLGALARLSVLLAGNPNDLTKAEFTASELKLTSKNTGLRMGGGENVAAHYTGEPLTIGFSSHQLSTVFSAMAVEQVELCITAPEKPIIIRPAEDDKADMEQLYLVMPMVLD